MNEELKRLIEEARSQGATDNDIKRIIDMYVADEKKKRSSKPTAQEEPLESPTRTLQQNTSSDTDQQTRAQASVALGGPTKLFGQEQQQRPKSIMYGDGLETSPIPSIPINVQPKKYYRVISDERKDIQSQIKAIEDKNLKLGRSIEEIQSEGTYQYLQKKKDQLDEEFKPAEVAIREVKKEATFGSGMIEKLISSATEGKYSYLSTETIKLDKDVEDKLIDIFDNSPEEIKQKWYKGSLPLDKKEEIINSAKTDVLNNSYKSLKEENKNFLINVKDNPNISNEDKILAYNKLKAKNDAFDAKVASDFSSNLLKDNFKATTKSKDLDEAILKRFQGFLPDQLDVFSSLLEGMGQVSAKVEAGIPEMILMGAERFNQAIGTSNPNDYTPIEATLDMINDTTNLNFLPSSKTERGKLVSDDGSFNWSLYSIEKSLANTLPFTLKIINDVKKGRIEGAPQSMISQLVNPKYSKGFADNLRVTETAYKATIGDNYRDAKDMGMDDSKAFTYANVMSLAEGISENIMPDFKYFDSLTGSTLKSVFKGNLKEATTKQALKNVTKDFFKNVAGELGEEEFVLAVEDGLKYSLLLNHKNSEFFNIKRQKELMAATVIMSGGMGVVGASGKYKQNKTDIYKEVYNNISNLQDSFNYEINSPLNDEKTKQTFRDAYKFSSDVSNAIAKAPENVTADQVDLLVQKNKLEEKKKTIDAAFHPDINEEIAGIDTKIRELAKAPAVEEMSVNAPVEEVEVKTEAVQTEEAKTTTSGQRVSDVLNRPATLESFGGTELESPLEGNIYQDGQRVIFEDKNNKTYDLGNVDEISDTTVEELGIKPQTEIMSVTPEGKIKVGENTWNIQTELPNNGVEYDTDGNVKAVSLKGDSGKTVMYEGQIAEDIAYQTLLNQTQTAEQRQAINEILENDEELNRQFREAEEAAAETTGKVVEPSVTKTEATATEEIAPSDIETTLGEVITPVSNNIKEQISRAKKAISKFLPNVEIVYHTTAESFQAVVGDNSRGYYDTETKKIHVNGSNASKTTVAHEVFHAVILKYISSDKQATDLTNRMFKALAKSIKNNPKLLKDINKFAESYSKGLQSEEKLAEVIGYLASEYETLPDVSKNIIQKWIEKIAKMVGIKKFTDQEVVDFMNTIATKVAYGQEITEADVKAINQGSSTYIAEPTEINRYQKVKEEKVKVGDHKLSFVKESDLIDMDSLMKEISDKKEKVWFWVADQLGRGDYYDSVIDGEHYLDAGPSFALDPENRSKNIIWATGKAEKEITKLIGNSDYIFIISGSPLKSKLFNKSIIDIISKRAGDFNSFKKNILNASKIKPLNDVLSSVNSWEELRDTPKRKEFLLNVLNQADKNTPLKKELEKYNSIIDLNELRDGFYADNNFELNDIMLVLKPTEFGGKSNHSTYENNILGEVIGVPDIKVNAFDILPSEIKDKYKGELGKSQQQQAVAPYGIGVRPIERKQKEISPENSSNYANMTEDGKGNFVFYHFGPRGINAIDPKRYGSNKGAITSKPEIAAMGRVGGMSQFYTMPEYQESNVSGDKYMIKVPMDRVYDFNTDPENFYDKAKEMFKKKYPDLPFTPNDQLAYITKLADKAGYDMTVAEWNNMSRAQSTKALKPIDTQVMDGNVISKPFQENYESNSAKGFESVIPTSKEAKLKDVYQKINAERNTKNKYDSLYSLAEDFPKLSQDKITDMIESSDISQEMKDAYAEALAYEPGNRMSGRRQVDAKAIATNTKAEVDRVKALPINAEDGATFNLDGTKYEGGGLVVPMNSLEGNTTQEKISPEMIGDFAKENEDSVGDEAMVKMGIYKFPDSDTVSIDMNIVIPNEHRDIALEFGKLIGQESLFDLDTFENVKTGGDGLNPMKLTAEQFREAASSLKNGVMPTFVSGRSQKSPIDIAVSTAKTKGFNDKTIIDYLIKKGYTRAQATNAVLRYNSEVSVKAMKSDSVFTREGRNKVVTFLDSMKRRWLSAKGFLPKSIFIFKEKIESNIKAETKRASYLVDEFNKLVKNYDGDLDVLESEADKYLRGEDANIPDEFKAVIGKMRIHIDNLSQMLLKNGAVSLSQAETIAKNLGQYVNRSYKVFDKSNWSKQVTEEMKEAARTDLRKIYRPTAEIEASKTGMDVDIILEDFINKKIDELINNESAATFLGIGKTGSKDLSIMKQKTDIPLSIRQLMGEYTDASQNYARTVLKIATFAENARYLKSARDAGMGVFFYDKNDLNRPDEFNTPIASEGSETMSPLNGLMTTPEIANAFKNKISSKSAIDAWFGSDIGGAISKAYETYMKVLSTVKWMKTIASVATHSKNVTGNIWFMLSNGYVNPKNYAVSFNTLKNSTNEELRDKLDEFIRAGIIDQSAALGEIKAMFSDADFDTAIDNRLKKNPIEKAKSKIKKTKDFLNRAYQLEDDFFKIISYESEKNRRSEAYFNKPFNELTDDQKLIVTEESSEITKNVLPNYGRIPNIVKITKIIPVIGTFVSFQAEAYRTAWNTVALAGQELKSDNKKIKSIGAKRLAGIVASQSLKYGLMALIGTAIRGGDDDDDDDQTKYAKMFVAPWSKDSDIVLLNDYGDGKMSYIDFSASDPHGGIKKAYNSMMAGDGFIESFANGMKQIFEPFVKEDILMQAITDVASNKNPYGGKLYNEKDTDINKIKVVYKRFWDVLEPGTLKSVMKISESENLKNEIIGQMTGYKVMTVDVNKQLGFKMSDLKDEESEARRLYNSAVYKFNENKISKEELDSAYNQANTEQKDVYLRMIDNMKAASFFGANDYDITMTMKDNGLSKSTINSLWYGETPELKTKTDGLTDEEIKQKNPELYKRMKEAESRMKDKLPGIYKRGQELLKKINERKKGAQ